MCLGELVCEVDPTTEEVTEVHSSNGTNDQRNESSNQAEDLKPKYDSFLVCSYPAEQTANDERLLAREERPSGARSTKIQTKLPSNH